LTATPRARLLPKSSATHKSDGAPSLFDQARGKYQAKMQSAWRLRWVVLAGYLLIVCAGLFLIGRNLGTDIFPNVDTGQFQLRLQARSGTRIERTEVIALKALDAIKAAAGSKDGVGNVAITLGFVGAQPPSFPMNTIYLWTSGPQEAVLLVALRKGSGIRLDEFKERLRKRLPEVIPGVDLSFEAGDVVSQIMNFGAPRRSR